MCQKATKSAIADAIAAEARQKEAMLLNPNQTQNVASYDAVPSLTRKHFEQAWATARMSVTGLVINSFVFINKIFHLLYRIWPSMLNLSKSITQPRPEMSQDNPLIPPQIERPFLGEALDNNLINHPPKWKRISMIESH